MLFLDARNGIMVGNGGPAKMKSHRHTINASALCVSSEEARVSLAKKGC